MAFLFLDLSSRVLHSCLKCKSPLLITYTFKPVIPESDELDVSLVVTIFSEGTEEIMQYHLAGSTFSSDNDVNVVGTKTLSIVLCPIDGDEAIALEEQGVHIPAEQENGWITRCYKLSNLTEEDIITDLDLSISTSRNVTDGQQHSKFGILLGQIQIIPLDVLFEQKPLTVKCTLVETSRNPLQMEVTSVVTWSEGADQMLIDSYDIFCQLKWTRNDDSGESFTETRYVGTTRRCVYKMNNFPLTNPGNESFRICFIVRENLIGLISKDLDGCAFDEVSF